MGKPEHVARERVNIAQRNKTTRKRERGSSRNKVFGTVKCPIIMIRIAFEKHGGEERREKLLYRCENSPCMK